MHRRRTVLAMDCVLAGAESQRGRPLNSVVRLHMIGDVVSAIALDMDGVLLRSNDAKFRAMLGLFQEYPTKIEGISQFILRNGGVPRVEKLTYILESIIRIPAPEIVLTEYLAKYETALEGALSAASLVPGAEEFLSTCECPLYLCSSAPSGEVSRQLGARNLLGYFAETFDSRTPKDVALKLIASRHGNAGVVFFGDSLGDLSAARSAQVPFVAVVAEWDNFPEHKVVKLHDFADRRAIQRCISEAANAYAI
jgi:phosphoglycolate phosphatase-like HAD superfamily hydrolase